MCEGVNGWGETTREDLEPLSLSAEGTAVIATTGSEWLWNRSASAEVLVQRGGES